MPEDEPIAPSPLVTGLSAWAWALCWQIVPVAVLWGTLAEPYLFSKVVAHAVVWGVVPLLSAAVHRSWRMMIYAWMSAGVICLGFVGAPLLFYVVMATLTGPI